MPSRAASKPNAKSIPGPGRKPAAPGSRQVLSPRGRGSVAKPPSTKLQSLFAANVRRVRLARDLSQEALADLADLDRTYISSVERNLRNISIGNIERIAEALRVDPRMLLDPQLPDNPL